MSFTVTINGTNRTSSIQAKSFRKRDVLNQQVDTCQFDVKKYGSLTFTPAVGQEVVVDRNGTTIFGGVVTRITEKIEASTILIYSVECVDYSQYLKRHLVTERYVNMTVSAIVADLVTNYTTAGDAITSTSTTSTLVIESISFNRLNVADSLQKLADAINYVWYIDYDKDIHFFAKNAELAPFSLTDNSNNYIYNSLEIIDDITQLKNEVLVEGGETVSASTRTEEFNGDGTIDVFRLANKFSSKPTVTVGGVAQTVGTEFLDDDASFDCMWNFNEKYLRFTAGNIPTAGTRNVDVTGYYLYPIVVNVPSPASQTVHGTWEFPITDKSIRSQAEAIERARAELVNYQNQLYEGRFKTYNDGLRSGQVLSISSTQRGKAIDVLIQSVSAFMRDPLGTTLEYDVSFATMKSIGIIEYLQNQLRSKEVIVDDQETILTFNQLTDTMGSSDTIATPTASTGPYLWGTAVWGYSTWG